MSSDSHKHILEGLDKWIELLNNPASSQRNRIAYLQEKRDRIMDNPDAISSLNDGNIWGGMGSFLDCVALDPFYYRPTASIQSERDEHWQKVHRRCDEWQRQFNEATIQLASALIEWSSLHGGLSDIQKQIIGEWIQAAKRYNEHPLQPLERKSIETLEWNLKFFDSQSGK